METGFIPAERLMPGFPNAKVQPSKKEGGDAKEAKKEAAPAAAFAQINRW